MRKPIVQLLLVLVAIAALAVIYNRMHRAPTPTPPVATMGPVVAQTATGACGDNLWAGKEPVLPEKMAKGLTMVCYRGYASANSAITRTPLWSAEHLTAERIAQARQTERASSFFAEPSLPYDARGELGDYRRSGFDRGHLSPSGDMPGHDAQAESFSLANIAPQESELNRGPWSELEGQVRDMVQARGEAWVVTGVLFVGDHVSTTPDGRVMVPTSFWKAVALPGGQAAVFLAPNTPSGKIRSVSLEEFRQHTGIVPFPALTTAPTMLELN